MIVKKFLRKCGALNVGNVIREAMSLLANVLVVNVADRCSALRVGDIIKARGFAVPGFLYGRSHRRIVFEVSFNLQAAEKTTRPVSSFQVPQLCELMPAGNLILQLRTGSLSLVPIPLLFY